MSTITGSITMDVLTIALALLAVVYLYFKRKYRYWKIRNVPYFEPSVPFGNIQPPYRRFLSFGDEMTKFYYAGKAKGWKYFGIYVLSKPVLVVNDLDLIKNIMTKDFNSFTSKGVYCNTKDDPMGTSLLTALGNEWKHWRTKFSPTFTPIKIKAMFQTMVDCGILLERFIKTKIEEKVPVDVKSVVSFYSIDVIGSCAFGLNCNSFTEPDSPFTIFCGKIFERNSLGVLKTMLAKTFPEASRFFGICSYPEDVTKFFTEVVENTVAYREKHVERKDLLQMLIDIKNNKDDTLTGYEDGGKTLTMNGIVGHSFSFFIGGYETSAVTMTFVLYELAINPDIQDRVREELKEVMRKYNNKITYDSLTELEYMGQVIDETLRKYGPALFLSRECTADYKLPDSGLVIEKGTLVVFPIKGIHYDEEYYENPDIFKPERFTEEAKRKRHQYAHLPFGEGPRICIGMRFALVETKVGLTYFLRNCKVTLSEKTKVPLKMAANTIVSSAVGGIWLNVEKV